jgi:hypothetical protein
LANKAKQKKQNRHSDQNNTDYFIHNKYTPILPIVAIAHKLNQNKTCTKNCLNLLFCSEIKKQIINIIKIIIKIIPSIVVI